MTEPTRLIHDDWSDWREGPTVTRWDGDGFHPHLVDPRWWCASLQTAADMVGRLTGAGVAFVTPSLRYIVVNNELVAANPGGPECKEDYQAKRLIELFPDLDGVVQPIFERVRNTGQPYVGPIESVMPDGQVHRFVATYSPMACSVYRPGECLGFSAILTRADEELDRAGVARVIAASNALLGVVTGATEPP